MMSGRMFMQNLSHYTQTLPTIIQKFRVRFFKMFFKEVSCSPRLNFFDQNYRKLVFGNIITIIIKKNHFLL